MSSVCNADNSHVLQILQHWKLKSGQFTRMVSYGEKVMTCLRK